MSKNVTIQQLDPNTFEYQTYSDKDNELIVQSQLDTVFNSETDILILNKFGIPEPQKKKKVIPDILFIPLVSFDKNLFTKTSKGLIHTIYNDIGDIRTNQFINDSISAALQKDAVFNSMTGDTKKYFNSVKKYIPNIDDGTAYNYVNDYYNMTESEQKQFKQDQIDNDPYYSGPTIEELFSN